MPLHSLIHRHNPEERPILIFKEFDGGTFIGCKDKKHCFECGDLLNGFKNYNMTLPEYIIMWDFREQHINGYQCFNTLTQWYDVNEYIAPYKAFEFLFRFV
jgi:hypothetical protein